MSDVYNIQKVLARYVRAADHRDDQAMSSLFMPNGRVEIYQGQQQPEFMGALEGAEAIGQAVSGMMLPHPPRGWSHHTTQDHIIEIDGDTATMDAQFIVYSTLGFEKPANGWPKGVFGAQGTIRPIEAGYYRSSLIRKDCKWKIAEHRIYLDLPPAFGGDAE
jgi:hypothetical protein